MTALDRKLIGGVIILAALLFIGRWWPIRQNGLVARIELAGRLVKEINLQGAVDQTVTINMPRGKAYLDVKDQAVKLEEMPLKLCPRKICSHTGWIRRPGEMIICVPNRLVIRLVSPEKPKVDVIVR